MDVYQCIGSFGKFNKLRILFLNDVYRTLNGVGSILGLVVNMVVAYFIMKLITKVTNVKPPPANNTGTDFSQFDYNPPVPQMPMPMPMPMPIPVWANDPTMGNAFYMQNA